MSLVQYGEGYLSEVQYSEGYLSVVKKSGVEVCLNSVVCGASYENLYSDIPKEGEEEGMKENNKVTISLKKYLNCFIFTIIIIF